MAYSYDDREGETRQEPPRRPPKKDDNDFGSWAIIAILFAVAWPVRSEERRVGKECRSRWSPYH